MKKNRTKLAIEELKKRMNINPPVYPDGYWSDIEKSLNIEKKELIINETNSSSKKNDK